MSTISALQARAFEQAKAKGFHDHKPATDREQIASDAEKIALMHSELSEALEELRNGRPVDENWYRAGTVGGSFQAFDDDGKPLRKPEGVPAELADTVIRILDFCGARGINLEAAIIEKLDYNATRGRMHGGKKF